MKNIITKKIIITFLLCVMFSFGLSEFVGVEAATNYWATPATITKVTEETFDQLIDPRADGSTEISERINGTLRTYTPKRERYNPDDRQWQGLSSLVKVGDRLWSAWYTGGTGEPRQFNYIVIAYSDDDGKTWVDPFLIIDHEDPNRDGVSLGVPNLFVNEDGQLCLMWIQYYTWVVKFHDAGDPDINKVTWDEPVIFTKSKIHKTPTPFIDQDGTSGLILASEAEAGDTHIGVTRFYVSKDEGQTWQLRSILPSSSSANRLYPESQVAQAADGSLIVVSRIENGTAGGVEVAISKDYGFTWGAYENNLEQPFIGPGSKLHIMKLDSGNLLVVNHSTTSSRASLVAYLSMDNGVTFPYSISIDARNDVSYPYAFESEGKIYVTWDKGRYLHKEIRYAVITEEDIIAGEYQSEESVKLGIISKLSKEFKDIVSINEAYESTLTYPVGTLSSKIRESLPTSIQITDNEGTNHTIDGVWKSPGFYQDIEGKYQFYFQADLPLNVEDTYELLKIKVILEQQEKTAESNSNVYLVIGFVGIGVISLGVATYVVLNKRKASK